LELDKNKDERIFDFVMTVPAVIDKEGESMPDNEMEEALDGWLINGAPISMEHTNKIVGKGLRWWRAEYGGNKAYVGRGKINNGPVGDIAWQAIKDGKYKDVSIGGAAFSPTKMNDGSTELRDLEILDVALCEEGMHPNADILDYNKVAKGTYFFAKGKISDVEKKVVKRGNQWCVVHCHGPEAGQTIKCFDTKEQADAMHAAIQANKSQESTQNADCAECTLKRADPHSEKFKRCVEHVKEQGSVVDPFAVCTAALGEEAFKSDSQELSITKQLKGGVLMVGKEDEEPKDEKPEKKPEDKPEEKTKSYVTVEDLAKAFDSFKKEIISELKAPAEMLEEARKQGKGGEPSPDGTEEDSPEGEPSDAESDKGAGSKEADLSKLPNSNKAIAELVKSEVKKALAVEKASTPRPNQATGTSTEIDAYEVAKGAKKADFAALRDAERARIEQEIQGILGR
jgi:hypothetical protein